MNNCFDFDRGVVTICGEKFCSGYTFEDFKKSIFYDNQDGIRIIELPEKYRFDNRNYAISICFINNKLYAIDFMCVDKFFDFENEYKRKLFHDEILKSYGIEFSKKYEWGEISSGYDPKGNVSEIHMYFIID